MDPFEGEAFEHVSKFKCTVVGPMCLMSCLQKGEPVPQLPYPMFTAAMKGKLLKDLTFSEMLNGNCESFRRLFSNCQCYKNHMIITFLG